MKQAGIYIHIPFCRSRCSYCDFATGTYDAPLAERYVSAVATEIKAFAAATRDTSEIQTEVETIYFGGGTPSLLAPAQLAHILDAVHARFNVAANAEVTMEMNPGTLMPETLRAFKSLGINRASFGAQTFDDLELRRLGRVHNADDVRRTIRDLRDVGYANVSFDLIAGLPAQTLDAWSRNLDEALALRPEHLSLYLLEVHEGTPLSDQIRRGMQPAPTDDDTAAEMYRLMLDRTHAAGYEHYEISNFCLPGYESRHNTKYWTGVPVFGFGCVYKELDERFKDDPERRAEEGDKVDAANPLPPTPLSVLIDHIDHIVKVAGIDHVGLGADFDGAMDMPQGARDVSELPNITYELLRRGYSEKDIRKILGENFLRVFAEVERVARIQSRQISGEGSLKRLSAPVK